MTITAPAATTRQLTAEELEFFNEQGYLVVRNLLSRAEVEERCAHFMELHARGTVPGYFTPKTLEEADGDLLRAYPRMLMPHIWDEKCRDYTLDARLLPLLQGLFGEEPLAAQSMLYFKPPGARGQALHQDNFYLQVQPGTCLAAWLALDDSTPDNGGLSVVPGSHRLDLLCPHAADLTKSFTIEEVDVPAGMEAVPVQLNAGDVLFFNGSVIHGSGPNRTADRFRRSFICHYVPESTRALSDWNQLMTFDGQSTKRDAPFPGGPCGTDEIEIMRAAVIAHEGLAQTGREQGAIGF